jgi:glycosyltransferase involved in cell wall biosynthesis
MNTMVITVSEAGRLHHLHYGNLPPGKVITMYNGVDLGVFGSRDEPARRSLRRELRIQPEAPVIATVAVLRKPKGIQHLIGALADILPSMPETKLIIVGDGDEGPALRRRAADLQLDDHVVFTGARSDIADVLAMSNLFVLPTLEDVLPTVVAEAMAAGLPVVASDVGGLPEMVVDGVTGLLVPPADEEALADACLELLTDRRKAEAMGLAGRNVAKERFDVQHQSKLLEDFYVSMLHASEGIRGSRTSSA